MVPTRPVTCPVASRIRARCRPSRRCRPCPSTPRTAKGFEGGVKASLLDNTLTGSLTAFRYKYEGLPLTSLIALSSTAVTFVTQNAASTITRGVEFESTWRPV